MKENNFLTSIIFHFFYSWKGPSKSRWSKRSCSCTWSLAWTSTKVSRKHTQINRQVIAGILYKLCFWNLHRLTNVEDWYSILHQKSILMAICSHCHHSLKSCSNPEVVQASLGLLLTVSKSPQGCQGLLAVDLSQMVCFLFKMHIIHTIILGYFTTRTTDARWGNLLRCTAENQIPIPNF